MREMNLLPEEYLYEQEEKRRKRKFISLTSIFIIILIIIYFIIVSIRFTLERSLLNVSLDIASLQNIEEDRLKVSSYENTIAKRKDLLTKLDYESIDQFTFLNALEKTLPLEVTLDTLFYSDRNVFRIEGKTSEADKISELMVNLAKIEGVENVMLHNVNHPIGENSSPYFSIDFTYSLEGEGK